MSPCFCPFRVRYAFNAIWIPPVSKLSACERDARARAPCFHRRDRIRNRLPPAVGLLLLEDDVGHRAVQLAALRVQPGGARAGEIDAVLEATGDQLRRGS